MISSFIQSGIKNKNTRGIYLMLLSMFVYVLSDAIVKEFMEDLHSIEIIFFRNLFSIIIVLILVQEKPFKKKVGNRTWLLITRSIFGFIAGSTFLYCIQNMSFANAVVFVQSSAIFSSLIAFIILRELLSKWQVLAVIIGFVGIILIVKPDIYMQIDKNNIIGLICAISAAITYVSIRDLREYYETRIIVLSVLIAGTILPAMLMIIAEFYIPSYLNFIIAKFVLPETKIFLLFIAIAGFNVVAQISKTKAYSYGKTGMIGVIGYSRVVFAFIFGILLGDIFPDVYGLLGIILVVIGGSMTAYFRRGREWEKTLVDGKEKIHQGKVPGWGMLPEEEREDFELYFKKKKDTIDKKIENKIHDAKLKK